MNIEVSLTLISIYGDYSMWSIADVMMMKLSSEKPEESAWALEGLKKLGKLREEQHESGYLDEHYKSVLNFLDSISIENRKSNE